ncbi:MAG: hypothetical protein E7262_06640 [Lachnospiraceae bacterium]|nr:hypothetical protein [Lachnospiraceae bacterium]
MKKTLIIIIASLGIICMVGILLVVVYMNSNKKTDAYETSAYEQLIKAFELDKMDLKPSKKKGKEPSFHGDGMALYEFNVSDKNSDKIEKMLEKSWDKGEFSKEVEVIMYGGETEETIYDYKYGEKVDLPKIENGYWKLINENDGSLLDNANDFKLAVYDIDNLKMYIFENHI